MRLLLVPVLMLGTGCNAALGLEPTESSPPADAPDPRVDEDLDGIPNEVDNCPGVPNPDQADFGEGPTPDGIGDACDPHDNGTGDVVMERYYFNDPADRAAWTPASAFTFEDGHVAISPTAELSYLHGPQALTINRGSLTIEAGFELVDRPMGTRVGVYTDDPQAHYMFVELRPEPYIVVAHQSPLPAVCDGIEGCDEEFIPSLPARVVVQLRSGADLKAILAGTGVDSSITTTGVLMNRVGVLASARARLLHVIVYARE